MMDGKASLFGQLIMIDADVAWLTVGQRALLPVDGGVGGKKSERKKKRES